MPLKCFSIYPTYAVEWRYFDESERATWNYNKPPPRINTGAMSRASRKKLMNATNWLKLFTPLHSIYDKETKKKITFRMNFITLTLSQDQNHADEYIKKHMLQPFLKWLSRKGASTYIWKSETQNNGNIHFHITCNRFIHWREIRNKWNQLQLDNGYLDNYFAIHKSYDANSTDIHAVRDDSRIGGYIVKYFGKLELWCKSKSDKQPGHLITHPSRLIDESIINDKPLPVPKRQISGRKWAISNNLTNLKCTLTEQSDRYNDDVTAFIKEQDYKHFRTDFANIWLYNHLIDSSAPESIVHKLNELKTKSQEK